MEVQEKMKDVLKAASSTKDGRDTDLTKELPSATILTSFAAAKEKQTAISTTSASNDRDQYVSALKRYVPKKMSELWSERNKFGTWRKVWVALADAQEKIGIYDTNNHKRVTVEQVEELRAAQNLNDDEFLIAEKREAEIKHDVMSHIYAYGLRCPKAKDIIHLGATSMDIQDNAELMLMRDALQIIREDMCKLLEALQKFALQHKDLPTLGFTHFQAAQLVTVGKRAAMWAEDFVLMFEQLTHVCDTLKARGAQGATGTQGTFLELFNGDHEKVDQFNNLFCQLLGFEQHLDVTGQTYSRVIDHNILSVLGGIAACAEKMATDVRLLIGKKEFTEGRSDKQVGSSAMAYKRNPVTAERTCGLSQYLTGISTQPAETLSKQWLERTLNDSANRRFALPEAFLFCSSILDSATKLINGLEVWPKMIEKNMRDELPFMATEMILMACVKQGGDRQILHDAIHKHSTESGHRSMSEGVPNDLLERLKKDPLFEAVHNSLDQYTNPTLFIGRSPQIVEKFCQKLGVLLENEQEFRHRKTKKTFN